MLKSIKWGLLLYAILGTLSIMLIGVFLGEGSMVGVIGCIVALIVIIGLGFTTKKKLREAGKL
ncbi:YlaF family protein [Priestia filamentosa]|uniref:YlaF family protein n=1 Tax=Priestia filamentosa TaxID=1402861 RepID=UPI00397E8582